MWRAVSSGVPDLDRLLNGLVPGDNIVWSVDREPVLPAFEDAFIAEGLREGDRCHYVTTTDAPTEVVARFGGEVEVFDARAKKRFADLLRLEQALLDAARDAPTRFVVEGLDAFARRQGRERALGLFTRVCPQLFDLGAIAYWRVPRHALGAGFVEQLRRVTQCVIHLDGDTLRVLKAEGHREGIEGQVVRVTVDPDERTPRLTEQRALARLATGLRRLREQRHLTQAEVARLAGVSPSAISQAEAGHRGLSLETIMTLSDQLQVPIDELLAGSGDRAYLLARRDRQEPRGALTALFDDRDVGLRAYLLQLGPGEVAAPPAVHKGLELVMVSTGLVQLELGTAAPVMRAGDAVLVRHVAVHSWRNLLARPAAAFWILRD